VQPCAVSSPMIVAFRSAVGWAPPTKFAENDGRSPPSLHPSRQRAASPPALKVTLVYCTSKSLSSPELGHGDGWWRQSGPAWSRAKGQPGVRVEVDLAFHHGRKPLPIVVLDSPPALVKPGTPPQPVRHCHLLGNSIGCS
jgi:hypothetical protein